MSRAWVALLGLACTGLLVWIVALQTRLARLETRLSQVEAGAASIELADVMLKLQIHLDKLWFAGTAQNWELAEFYVVELRETLGGIEAANLVENGVELNAVLRSGLTPALKGVERAVAGSDGAGFARAYDVAVASCNTCHDATGHGFVVIRLPVEPVLDGQDYAPLTPPAG